MYNEFLKLIEVCVIFLLKSNGINLTGEEGGISLTEGLNQSIVNIIDMKIASIGENYVLEKALQEYVESAIFRNEFSQS